MSDFGGTAGTSTTANNGENTVGTCGVCGGPLKQASVWAGSYAPPIRCGTCGRPALRPQGHGVYGQLYDMGEKP